ncbi:MAG: M20 family metallopeptidase, partial [Dehalococcoidia bacterium]
MGSQDAYETARRAIDDEAPSLRELSLGIHARPELNFEEFQAHDDLAGYLERRGFRVERHAYEMATAFEAVAGSGEPTIAVMCEYDALPGIGHACGHNLIAMTGVAVGLALKNALGEGRGKVVVLGSPAEEGGGGKIFMAERGAFEDVDAALMLHPAPYDGIWLQANAIQSLTVTFHGRNAHAAGAPWEGVNALDAMIAAFNNVSLARQQLRPTDRVHGVITEGGLKPNIIPDRTSAEFYVRAFNLRQLEDVKEKILPCFEGAAAASRCTLDLEFTGRPYADVLVNDVMAARYAGHLAELGLTAPAKGELSGGGFSTDMGNVSYVVPSIHPMFGIPVTEGAGNHTPGFTACAATPEAHAAALRAAKALALTALDLYEERQLLESAKAEFEARTGGR